MVNKVLNVVVDLNEELYEKYDSLYEIVSGFSYSTDGNIDIISFDNKVLWCSETDERQWIEENNDYEPLMPHIKKLYNDWVNQLKVFSFEESADSTQEENWQEYKYGKYVDSDPWYEVCTKNENGKFIHQGIVVFRSGFRSSDGNLLKITPTHYRKIVLAETP